MNRNDPEKEENNSNNSQSKDIGKGKDGKVQLDIEDAPFFSKPEEKKVEPEKKEISDQINIQDNLESKEPSSLLKNKKKVIIIVSISVIFIILSGVLWFLFFSREDQPEKPIVSGSPTVVVVLSPKGIEGPTEYKMIFAPFMVEEESSTGVSFLQATFIGISKDENVVKESNLKELVLRDAIYYYLRNKAHSYLVDPKNTMEIKQDLLDIVNGYLGSGKMEDMLLENYIIK